MSFAQHLKNTSDENIQRLDFNDVFDKSLAVINDKGASPEVVAQARSDMAHATRLIRQIHRGLYQRTFPIPSEQEAVADWLERLKSGDKPQNLQLFTAYGKNLDDLKNATVAGFIVSEYYKGTELGLINYVIRDKEFAKGEKRFAAQEMCDDHVGLMGEKCRGADGTDLKGVLWEANKTHPLMLAAIEDSTLLTDEQKAQYTKLVERGMANGTPMKDIMLGGERFEDVFRDIHGGEYWQANDCMDPSKRISHIQGNFGAKRLGFDYAQAPLSPPANAQEALEGTCADLHLFAYKADAFPNLNAGHLAKYMNAFATIFAGKKPDQLGVESLDRMMAQLKYMEENNIPVLAEKQTAADRIGIDLADVVKPDPVKNQPEWLSKLVAALNADQPAPQAKAAAAPGVRLN